MQHVEVPYIENYNGKGDLVIYIKTFQTICSELSHDYRLMVMLFLHTFRDRALQWYNSLTPYSFDSFQMLSNSFIKQF